MLWMTHTKQRLSQCVWCIGIWAAKGLVELCLVVMPCLTLDQQHADKMAKATANMSLWSLVSSADTVYEKAV